MTRFLWVRRQPTGTAGKVPLEAFELGGWRSQSGGHGGKTPGYFIFGYISCDAVVEGEVGHSGSHGPCPHSIKVCVTKSNNDPTLYAALASQAGPKPHFVTHAERALNAIASAGPTGITRQHLIAEARIHGGYAFAALQRLIDNGEVTLKTEIRPNSIERPQRQYVYRLAGPP